MDSKFEVELLQPDQNCAISVKQRNVALQTILDKPFAGRVQIKSRDISVSLAKGEYDTIDLTNKLVFWIDASERNGRVGIAVVWKSEHFSVKWRHKMYILEGTFSANTGEFFAIATAIRIASKICREKQHDEDAKISNVTIYSDSMNALLQISDFHEAAEDKKRRFGQQLELAKLKERAQLLVTSGIEVEIKWVKGHQMVYGNNLADKLAAHATTSGAGVETLLPTCTGYLSRRRCKIDVDTQEEAEKEARRPRSSVRGRRMYRFIDLLKLD